MQLADDRVQASTDISLTGPAAAHRIYLQTKIFGSLDGIRALSCLLVVKAHAGWNTGIQIFDTPGLGVEMFFTISGFLIVTLLLREKDKTGTISLRNFYARRSLRIFPIYYAGILLVFLVTAFLAILHKPGPFLFYRFVFLVLLTYVQDIVPINLGSFHPCWSLGMEEQFYLFWPTIEKMKSVAVRWGVLFAVFLVSELVSFGVLKGVIQGIYHDPQANYMPIYLITFAPIALGVCLAHILHDPRTYKIAFRIFGYRWAWLGWTIILGLIFYFFPSDQAGVPRLLRHLTLMFLLASMVIREDHFAARPLRFPLLVRIGVISYGLYLYHQWIIDFSGRFIQRFVVWLGVPQLSGFLVFVITSALCIVFADLSFRFFESPILRLRHRFQSQ